jgi:hypothetical protein
MNNYESPTIEQAGGPENTVQPEIFSVAVLVFGVLDYVAAAQILAFVDMVVLGVAYYYTIATRTTYSVS